MSKNIYNKIKDMKEIDRWLIALFIIMLYIMYHLNHIIW
jgi:hypothetical protein